MTGFPSEKALVAAYWRKLASSRAAPHKSRGRAFGKRAAPGFQLPGGRASHSGAATVRAQI